MPWNFSVNTSMNLLLGHFSPNSWMHPTSTVIPRTHRVGGEEMWLATSSTRESFFGNPAYRGLCNSVGRYRWLSPALFLLSCDSACAPTPLSLDGARQVSGKRSDASLP